MKGHHSEETDTAEGGLNEQTQASKPTEVYSRTSLRCFESFTVETIKECFGNHALYRREKEGIRNLAMYGGKNAVSERHQPNDRSRGHVTTIPSSSRLLGDAPEISIAYVLGARTARTKCAIRLISCSAIARKTCIISPFRPPTRGGRVN